MNHRRADNDPLSDDPEPLPMMVSMQEKLAYLELRVSDLEHALAREAREHGALAERLDILERALQVLAARNRPQSGEVQGAFTVDDPVPHSG
jgi:hypothetical protein